MEGKMDNIPLMIKVSEMYYLDKLSQSEIAKKLKISTSTVSRILAQSLKKGIIKVEIVDIQKNRFSSKKCG
jgi:DNA-binding transcriptional regulator LsrR (DeoR family)